MFIAINGIIQFMKIATWNVNSLNVRLPQVLDWLAQNPVDALCLQETKQEDSKFPYAELEAAGYKAIHNGQKTYNGVAILSPHAMEDVQLDLPNFEDEQKRIIAATINGVRVISAYVVNGHAVGTEKYAYKMRWLAAFYDWIKTELTNHDKLAVLGDYNIAPEDRDCYDPEGWRDKVLVSKPEREAFNALLDLGLNDSYRLHHDGAEQYSWWDYRSGGFRRNQGLRIDHILITDVLKTQSVDCVIDTAPRQLERPSDHAPVLLTLSD